MTIVRAVTALMLAELIASAPKRFNSRAEAVTQLVCAPLQSLAYFLLALKLDGTLDATASEALIPLFVAGGLASLSVCLVRRAVPGRDGRVNASADLNKRIDVCVCMLYLLVAMPVLISRKAVRAPRRARAVAGAPGLTRARASGAGRTTTCRGRGRRC